MAYIAVPSGIKLGSSGQQALKKGSASMTGSSYVQTTPTNTYIAGAYRPNPIQTAVSSGQLSPQVIPSPNVNPPSSVQTSIGRINFPPIRDVTYTPPKTTSSINFSGLLNAIKPVTSNLNLLADFSSGNPLSEIIGGTGKALNLPEFGISELIRGGMNLQNLAGIPQTGLGNALLNRMGQSSYQPTAGTAAAAELALTGQAPNVKSTGQVLSSSNVNSGGGIYDQSGSQIGSAPTKVNIDTSNYQKYLNQEQQNIGELKTQQKTLQDYINSPSASSTAPSQDVYGLIDNQMNGLYGQQFSSDQDFYNQLAALRRNQAQRTYDSLVGQYQAQVPQLEQDLNTQTARATANLKDLQTQGEQQKTELGNIYGDIIKGIVANKNASTNTLKNMFSSLGTAESSDFLNRMGNLESGAGSDIATTQREQASKIATIDQALTKGANDTNNAIQDLTTEFNRKKDAIMQNINATADQKATDLENINAELAQNIQNLKDFYMQKSADLLSTRQSLLGQQDILNQQLSGNMALNNQTFQQNLALAQMNNIPVDLQAELDKYKYATMTPQAKAFLKAKYPSWSDIIDNYGSGGSNGLTA